KESVFLPAKIIETGEFTEGVGGGVCQVSTTLYKAAVLSGMKVVEYHPHSLAVGYVPPSRDAMVSGKAFDLKIKNPAKTPVYIRATTLNGSVNFTFYGADDGAEYSIKSSVTGSIPAPEEITEERDKARDGRDGITSEGYLEITRDGYTKRTLLRKDKYLPVKKIIYGGADENFENGESGENAEGAEDGADENIG
ncbi:MAG: VanW family protein, partial [Clostridia bacterium]|nr:VanW family protein [Clostridia bacterium]